MQTQICVYENDDESFKVKIGHNGTVSDSGDCKTAAEALERAVNEHENVDELSALFQWE